MRMTAQTPRMEAGKVLLPRDAPWLPDYLHELAMFPRGRHDDQADSTSQALAYISQPNDAEEFLKFMRGELLKPYGLTQEDLTVGFDYEFKSTEFTAPSGRTICREHDGFYWVNPHEWEAIKFNVGTTVIEKRV